MRVINNFYVTQGALLVSLIYNYQIYDVNYIKTKKAK